MEKFLPKILIGTFGVRILFVMIEYFKHHPEYLQAFSKSPGLFTSFLITFGVVFGGYFLYKKYYLDQEFKIKFSPLLFLLVGVFGVWLIGNLEFGIMQKTLGLTGYLSSIGAMFGNLLPVFTTLSIIFILSFVLGDRLSNFLKVKWEKENYGILNIVFGISVILFGLFILGLLGLLTKFWILGCAIFIAIFSLPSFKNFWNWFIGKGKEAEKFEFFSLETFLFIALFFLISVNIFDVIRPMPIGWDDMGVYMNMPKRIAEDAAILAGQSGQVWMLMTSLGFILWEGYVGTTVSMFINFFGGFLGILAVFAFINTIFKNRKMAIFGATFYYFMPMITFQSALDMKMDPTLFLFMVGSALIIFNGGLKLLDKMHEKTHQLSLEEKIKFGIGGFILATAFFIKITTAMGIFALLGALSFLIFNWKTAVGVIFLESAIFLLWFARIPEFTPEFIKILAGIFGVLGIIFIAISKIKKFQAKYFLDIAVSIGAGFLLVALPWASFNYSTSHEISFAGLVSGKFHERPKIDLASVGIDEHGADKQYCESTGLKEELGRYIGYDQPFFQKYFTLPWKNTMNTQVRGYYLDIGFLFLALLIGLILLGSWRRFGKMEWGLVILFSINWFFWAFVGMGVPWYGLFGFLPAIALLAMVVYDKKYGVGSDNYFKYLLIAVVIISISAFGYLRETKTFSQATVAYAFGKIDGDRYVDSIVPTYRDTVKLIDSYPRNPEDPNYLYRIGTFMPYFVKDVRRVMFSDSQLDRFKCIDGDGKDDARTLKRLKDLGFKFFVLDTNTYTIEKNPNGTLHKKYKRFIDFANKNLKILYYKPENGIAFMMIK
ncbi:hypothetical protein LR002_02100 [Candidatus Gracilibacteria bacterium]|nr:hypothetical protein [Candidatus Gracilibacteria bacterium]